MLRADAERVEIIRFWRTVELFNPQRVKKVSRERRVYAVKPGEPLPWDPEHELARVELHKNQVWRHVVYLGVYSLESVFGVLNQAFAPDEESFDERPAGNSALAAFIVSHEARPLIGSEVLSSCAWATGRARHPGPASPGWLAGFNDAETEFSARFADLVAPDPGDERAGELRQRGHNVGRLLGREALAACLDAAADVAAVGDALPHVEVRIRSEKVRTRNSLKVDGHDFLNSFVVDDLATVADQAGSGRVGAALCAYLRPDAEVDAAQRIDVRERLDKVLEATAPRCVPLGRWPSKPEHPLALSQQLAVNSVAGLQDVGTGLFAVNGPPGTGKTTMLRDLVAALVVERARRLTELADPRDAFTGQLARWKTGDYTRVVHFWKPQFTGFEMVVASANNGAVENVTNEIPAHDAIAEQWREHAAQLDYFPGIASTLLAIGSDDSNNLEDEEKHGSDDAGAGWALVAARLGNKGNRTRFRDTFWYGKSAGASSRTGHAANQSTAVPPPYEAHSQHGLLAFLKDYEQSTPPCSWPEAVAEFRRSLDLAASIQATRNDAYDTMARKARAEDDLAAAQQTVIAVQQQIVAVRAQLTTAASAAQAWQSERERRVRLRAEHRQFQPGFLEWLTTVGKAMRQWRHRDHQLAAEVAAAEQAMGAAHGELAAVTRDNDLAAEDCARREETVRRSERDLNAIQATLDQVRAALGSQFPDEDWWRDRSRRELGALWTDAEWNRARTELFLAALRLHKAFLHHVPTQMRQSLQGAADVVAGDAPHDVSEGAALAAWQALFFVVPVVSTTFASFARVFSHLGQEALGWVLIDEAGQATPQSAVGALWRSKRAVIIGDPLQLEPITMLPFRAEQAIRGDHGVDEQWLPSRTSVQRLADRLTHLGTWLPCDDGKIWVGAPLTVHRRCDQPMFGIANDVAYNGLMINGTSPRHAEDFHQRYPPLPESKWINVTSQDCQGHWIPAEGKQLDRILTKLAELDFDICQVMVIAPFRDIADHLRDYTNRYPGLVAGTIHTAQGKEAEIVILVLGSDPQRHGARRWAASKPNLLNVAVSRAKRRLYVIGDRQTWATHRHFDVLARRLPSAPPR